MQTYSLKVAQEDHYLRLDVFLTKNLPDGPSRSSIKKLIESGDVTVNGKKVKVHYKVNLDDEIIACLPDIHPLEIRPENIPLEIWHEDDDLIIVNKPIGLMVHPAQGCFSGTLVNALLHHCSSLSDISDPHRPGIVHRLDRETSGLMLVAKTNQAHVYLARQFAKHKIRKRYIALVEGQVEFDEGVVEASLGRHPRYREKRTVVYYESNDAKEAKTVYRVLKRFRDKSLIALFPQTGRTHQLRVHMAHLGHPILGDDKYGHKALFPRLALHAQRIGFFHPRTRTFLECSTKPPREFSNAE